MNTARSIRC